MANSFNPEKARVPPADDLPVPSISKFKIALCQLSVTADKERNIAHARVAIEDAAEKGAKLVLLPVIFYYQHLRTVLEFVLVRERKGS